MNNNTSRLNIVRVVINDDFNFEKHLNLFSRLEQCDILSYRLRSDRQKAFTSLLLKKYYLAHHLGCSPDYLQVTKNACGKPILQNNIHNIDFNISHTQNQVVMAIARSAQIGIDIEKISLSFNYHELLDQVFDLHEQSQIKSPADFYLLWTKKEALLKADGCGFGSPNFKKLNFFWRACKCLIMVLSTQYNFPTSLNFLFV